MGWASGLPMALNMTGQARWATELWAMGFLLILILEIDYQLGFKMENKTFRLNSNYTLLVWVNFHVRL
jgi:hypothetical protein